MSILLTFPKDYLKRTEHAYSLEGSLSEMFTVRNGVKHGGVLSLFPFFSVSRRIISTTQTPWKRMLYKWTVCECINLCRPHYFVSAISSQYDSGVELM